jgi:hypothetical protein
MRPKYTKRNMKTAKYPVLEYIASNSVFELYVEPRWPDKAVITESCDAYFAVDLNKKNLLRLAQEIKDFANNELK